jgi:hypothetical protein
MTMTASWKEKEDKVREILERELKVELPKKEVSLTGAREPYEFDMVSPDGTVVGETKSYTLGKGYPETKPWAKVAHTSEACLFLKHAKDAKKRLLVLTDRRFHDFYVEGEKKAGINGKGGRRQAQMVKADGITITYVRV